MTISPSTDLYLLKLPFELNDENQLTFDSASDQSAYFLSLDKIGETDFTYQRRENSIHYPAHVDSIIQYNYVMYKNDNYSNKWFYARILNMQYVNDGMTLIEIEEDAYQTWMFDITVDQCFVEREHVMDDTIGLHTVPEGIETGEYEIVDKNNIPLYETVSPGPPFDWVIVFCMTTLPLGNASITGESFTIGGVYTALHFFAVKGRSNTNPQVNPEAEAYLLMRCIELWDGSITSEAIKNVYVAPASVVDANATATQWTFDTSVPGASITIQVWPISDSVTTGPFSWQQSSHLAGNYIPQNNKLFCWPYSYAYLSNKVGENLVVHWEDFPTETIGSGGNAVTAKTITYKKALVPSASLSAKLYFTNYKGYAEKTDSGTGQTIAGTRMYEYGINFAKAPVCAWTTDYYLNWLTQNGVNQGIGIASAVAGGGLAIAGAALLGGPVGLALAGAAIGVATSVGNAMGARHQASVTPDNANGDLSSGDVMFAYNKCAISLYHMSVRPEMAYMIDQYFNAYGYKVNDLKTPNITGRINWNYVKTIGSTVHGDIPQSSIDRLNRMFDTGITFWHHPQTFHQYWQPNDIVLPSE